MPPPDLDGDGWSVQDGDCCDAAAGCAQPHLVNPGAFEYPGNGVDDDCDPTTDDNVATPTCSSAALMTPTTAVALAQALDVCTTTTQNAPLPQRTWGLISATVTLADGTTFNAANDVQLGVLSAYGSFVTPQRGTTMAALSSGTARAPNNPGYVHPQNGTMAGQTGSYNANTQCQMPAHWLSVHGSNPPDPPNCPECVGAGCTTAYDSVRLTLQLRVPTNATALTGAYKFYSAEYPEFLCGQYRDAALVLVTTGHPNAPLDRNVLAAAGGVPLGADDPRMTVCFPAPGAPPGACPSGTLELVGTGMGGWDNSVTNGAGTEWLQFSAQVVPGETVAVEFILWDGGDHNVDAVLLLDRLAWVP